MQVTLKMSKFFKTLNSGTPNVSLLARQGSVCFFDPQKYTKQVLTNSHLSLLELSPDQEFCQKNGEWSLLDSLPSPTWFPSKTFQNKGQRFSFTGSFYLLNAQNPRNNTKRIILKNVLWQGKENNILAQPENRASPPVLLSKQLSTFSQFFPATLTALAGRNVTATTRHTTGAIGLRRIRTKSSGRVANACHMTWKTKRKELTRSCFYGCFSVCDSLFVQKNVQDSTNTSFCLPLISVSKTLSFLV